jgi:hypothetical protein
MLLTFTFFFQDNSVCCWISKGKKLEQVPMHTDFPELKESTDVNIDTYSSSFVVSFLIGFRMCMQLSEVSDRCFGLTLAPGEQMIAVVCFRLLYMTSIALLNHCCT